LSFVAQKKPPDAALIYLIHIHFRKCFGL
jgi:hypothetical protein